MAKYCWPLLGHLPIFLGPPVNIASLAFRGIEGDVVEANIIGARFYLIRGAPLLKSILGFSSLRMRKTTVDDESTKLLFMHHAGIVLNDHIPLWKRSRKFLVESIGRSRFHKALTPGMNVYMKSLCAKMNSLSIEKKPILANKLMASISIDVITKIVLGELRTSAEYYVQSTVDLGFVLAQTDPFLVLMTKFQRVWNFLAMTPSILYKNLPWLKSKMKDYKIVIQELQDFIEVRVREIQANLNSQPQDDALDRDLTTNILIATNNGFAETVACVKEAIIGGQGTTSTSLSFVMYELARHPAVVEEIYHEIISTLDSNSDEFTDETIKKMPLLQASIYEIHRLYSIAVMVDRGLEEDLEVGNMTLKKGSQLLFTLGLNHHDEREWKDPKIFNPHRFLQMEESPGPLGCGYSFSPFGYGMRKCPGQALAMLEMALVIAHLVKHFKFHLVNRNMTVKIDEFGMLRECLDLPIQFVSRH
ncbi:UNVERIFIED_CONTAM: hypothetical protein HDU68_005822 [Siphonaria sp. JEL0065]|nr:hypothetical protein HDU68_005822 [Siphonaria sp. JEL0065]